MVGGARSDAREAVRRAGRRGVAPSDELRHDDRRAATRSRHDVRRRLQGPDAAPGAAAPAARSGAGAAEAAAGGEERQMTQMNMIQALNSAMDVMMERDTSV